MKQKKTRSMVTLTVAITPGSDFQEGMVASLLEIVGRSTEALFKSKHKDNRVMWIVVSRQAEV